MLRDALSWTWAGIASLFLGTTTGAQPPRLPLIVDPPGTRRYDSVVRLKPDATGEGPAKAGRY
jgi:hypothetical protein